MKVKSIIWITLAGVLALTLGALGFSNLPPNSRTGAPGETTCLACHADLGRLDSLSTTVRVTGIPSNYTPNTSYPVKIVVKDSRQTPPNTIWGFELTILRNSDNTRAGGLSFTAGPIDTGRTATRTYLKQRTAGNFAGADSAVWNFTWTSPTGGTGTVTMYLAANAGDNDGSPAGDSISALSGQTFETGVEEENGQRTVTFGPRFQVAPDPFVSFATVPGHEKENFALYDIRGRVVGIYPGARIGQGLPSGIYFLRPEIGPGSEKPLRVVKLR